MSQVLVRNRQRLRPVRVPPLRRLLTALLKDHLQLDSWELGVHLVDDAEMTRLNEHFLRHAGTTDVITFNLAHAALPVPEPEPGAALQGELFVCVPEAVRQARRFRTHWTRELARYLVHGTLHLTGYDDATPSARRRMKRQEDRLLRALATHVAALQTRKPRPGRARAPRTDARPKNSRRPAHPRATTPRRGRPRKEGSTGR
jgi:rRNA maturation RNase YbeY